MTEKRFKNNGSLIFDANKPLNTYDVVDLLNELNDENQMLKGEVAHYKLLLLSLEETSRRMVENWQRVLK